CQAEDGIRDRTVTGVQTCALPILEPRGNLEGNRLIVDKSVGVRRSNAFFVKLFSLDHTAFYSGDFRTHKRGTVFEVLRAVLCPRSEERRVGKERNARRPRTQQPRQ